MADGGSREKIAANGLEAFNDLTPRRLPNRPLLELSIGLLILAGFAGSVAYFALDYEGGNPEDVVRIFLEATARGDYDRANGLISSRRDAQDVAVELRASDGSPAIVRVVGKIMRNSTGTYSARVTFRDGSSATVTAALFDEGVRNWKIAFLHVER